MVIILYFLFLAFIKYRTRAQISNLAICTMMAQNWTTNHEKQSPCLVATALLNGCSGSNTSGVVKLTQLQDGSFYNPPSSSEANQCTCSSVTYAMISACAICQGGIPGPWDQDGSDAWVANCPADVISVSTYDSIVPNSTFIPVWAFQNVTTTGAFNAFAAAQLVEKLMPDVTNGADPVIPTSTGSSTTPSSTSPLPTRSPIAAFKKSNRTTIVGAVVGSVVGAICFSLFAWFYYIRYGKGKTPREHFETACEKSDTETQVESSIPEGLNVHYPMLKLYDPEDPSTFPKSSKNPPSMAPSSPISPSFTHPGSNLVEPLPVTSPGYSIQSHLTPSISRPVKATNPNFGFNSSDIMYRTIPE